MGKMFIMASSNKTRLALPKQDRTVRVSTLQGGRYGLSATRPVLTVSLLNLATLNRTRHSNTRWSVHEGPTRTDSHRTRNVTEPNVNHSQHDGTCLFYTTRGGQYDLSKPCRIASRLAATKLYVRRNQTLRGGLYDLSATRLHVARRTLHFTKSNMTDHNKTVPCFTKSESHWRLNQCTEHFILP